MPTHTKTHDEESPFAILTELAVEGTSSLVEAQRALLNLAQQENDIILNGVKERVGNFVPAAAMTDLVRRSLDTLLGMQQELLTTTSKQTLEWLQSEKAGKGKGATHLVEFAREGVETFTRAQKKFLEVVAQEAGKATSGKKEHESNAVKKAELASLARDAGSAFIEAQKRLLDVMGQQMNVNLNATTRAMGIMSPSRLVPVASRTGEGVREFVDAETSLIGSLIKPKKTVGQPKPKKARTARRYQSVPA
jgi:molybdenum-dependent DNA-binding transcriptional regulator ModE